MSNDHLIHRLYYRKFMTRIHFKQDKVKNINCTITMSNYEIFF